MRSKLAQQIGANLQKIRQQKGLTQSAVAEKAGTNTNYYAKLERGEAIPSITRLESIVKAIGVRSSDVLPF